MDRKRKRRRRQKNGPSSPIILQIATELQRFQILRLLLCFVSLLSDLASAGVQGIPQGLFSCDGALFCCLAHVHLVTMVKTRTPWA